MWKRFVAPIAVVFLISFSGVSTVGLSAEEEESNGAVAGLMPRVMELQFAALMEAKTLAHLNTTLVAQGREAIKTGLPISKGFAKGFAVTGDPADYLTWRYKGIEREIGPIRRHVTTLVRDIIANEKITKAQEKDLTAWLASFWASDAAFSKEPSAMNLDALADTLMLQFRSIAAFEQPEVTLLTTILYASTVEKQYNLISDHFFYLMQVYAADPKRIQENQLSADGLTLNPKAVLEGKEKAIVGLKDRYGRWVKTLSQDLAAYAKPGAPLLKGHSVKIAKIIQSADGILTKLESGTIEVMKQLGTLINDTLELISLEEIYAPVALRIEAGKLVSYQTTLFSTIAKMVDQGKLFKMGAINGGVGKLTYRVKLTEDPVKVSFTAGTEEYLQHLRLVRRLAEETLKRSTLADKDRKKLESAIDSLNQSEKAIPEATLLAKWVELSETVNQIHWLYRF